MNCSDDFLRDLVRRGDRSRRRDRIHERDVVDLLQRSLAPPESRSSPREGYDRRAVEARLREGAHRVRDARPSGDRGHADPTSEPSPALGSEGCALLMPRVDDADPVLTTAIEYREDVAAGEREEVLHTQRS